MLFTAWSRNLEDAQIVVQRLDTHERRTIIRGGTSGRYVPTGHIVYAQAGTLLAVSFDLSRLKVTGDAISVAEGVSLTTEGIAQFDISNTGSLVYIPGRLQEAGRKLMWVDRKGAEKPLAAPPPRAYFAPRLSPDGQQVAVTIQGANDDIWVFDISRETLIPLTFGARSTSPVWTPDGKRIIFRSVRAGSFNLFSKFANGGGEEERLTVSQYNQVPHEVSPDGQTLVFLEDRGSAGLWILPLAGDRKARPFHQTPSAEGVGSFSPDGHWLAYASDESGRREVYVRPFPAGQRKWPISTEGGGAPRWARSGELFYSNGDKIMAVDITTQPDFAPGNPRMLFEGQYVRSGLAANYDVSPDGQRFLMLEPGESAQAASTQLNVVLNWLEELKALVPRK